MESDSTSSFSSYSSSSSSDSSSYGSYSSFGAVSDSFNSSVSFSSFGLSSFGSGWSTPSFGGTDDSFSTPSSGGFGTTGTLQSYSLVDYFSSPAGTPSSSVSMFDMPMFALPAFAAPDASAVDAESNLLTLDIPSAPVEPPTIAEQGPALPVRDWDYSGPMPEVEGTSIEAPAETDTVAIPVLEPAPIESHPLAPLPPHPESPVIDEWNYVPALVAQPLIEPTHEQDLANPAPLAEPELQPVVVSAPAEQASADATDTTAPNTNQWADHDIESATPASTLVIDEAPPQPAETDTVATPVRQPGPIESRLLAPLPPEPQSIVAKRGDTLWKYAGGDVATIGDLALKNHLNTSQIIAGRMYDTTPMDRENLSPADIRLREQIGQAYLNQDNARLATLAEAARQQEANRIAQANAANVSTGTTGPVSAGSFAQGATPQATGLDPRFNGFLAEKGGNTFATLAQSPGAGLGRVAFTALGFADANATTRAAGQSGIGTGLTRYNPGEVSVMGIDNYTVTSLNKGAVGATLGGTLTLGTNGFAKEGISIDKAQSLLTDTMFEVQPNGVGKPGEALRVTVAYKHLAEIGKVQEVRTDGVYQGLNRKEVAVVGASLSGGIGASIEVAAPFMPNRKIGAEASAIVDFTAAETKQISAAGVIADPQTGVYGAAFGVDSRNRLGSAALTVNGGVDIGVARGKITAKGSGSVYGLGIGGNASAAWNDKTGTLTYQASASYTLGLGAGLDLSGELQSDFAKGIVAKVSTLIAPPVQPQPRP